MTVWRPRAPAGYVAMGDVCTPYYGGPPSTSLVRCVRRDLVAAAYGEWAWDDEDTGGDVDVTFWRGETGFHTLLAPHTFVAQADCSACATPLWCFKTEVIDEMDCDETISGNGTAYLGCQATTKTGKTCKAWSTASGHTKSDSHFCRNPANSGTIWCYTTNGSWDYCETVEQARQTFLNGLKTAALKDFEGKLAALSACVNSGKTAVGNCQTLFNAVEGGSAAYIRLVKVTKALAGTAHVIAVALAHGAT